MFQMFQMICSISSSSVDGVMTWQRVTSLHAVTASLVWVKPLEKCSGFLCSQMLPYTSVPSWVCSLESKSWIEHNILYLSAVLSVFSGTQELSWTYRTIPYLRAELSMSFGTQELSVRVRTSEFRWVYPLVPQSPCTGLESKRIPKFGTDILHIV